MSKKFIIVLFILVILISCSVVGIFGKINKLSDSNKVANNESPDQGSEIQMRIEPVQQQMKAQDIRFSSEIIELTNNVGQNFFVNYRIKREQFRQESKEMLSLLLESDIQHTREQAQQYWLELSQKIAKEGEIENVLKMKGFRDVVSEVNRERTNITILSTELKLQEIFLIKSVTSNITGLSEDKIEVTARA